METNRLLRTVGVMNGKSEEIKNVAQTKQKM